MTRANALLVLVSLTVPLLAGCGGGPAPSASPLSTPPPAPATTPWPTPAPTALPGPIATTLPGPTPTPYEPIPPAIEWTTDSKMTLLALNHGARVPDYTPALDGLHPDSISGMSVVQDTESPTRFAVLTSGDGGGGDVGTLAEDQATNLWSITSIGGPSGDEAAALAFDSKRRELVYRSGTPHAPWYRYSPATQVWAKGDVAIPDDLRERVVSLTYHAKEDALYAMVWKDQYAAPELLKFDAMGNAQGGQTIDPNLLGLTKWHGTYGPPDLKFQLVDQGDNLMLIRANWTATPPCRCDNHVYILEPSSGRILRDGPL